ncbi:hypothetical protein HU200_016735 [Digitaria exilis]|uniref:Uncharacterized protein n=1 Tax=Digitaria exilis TaxID=1010633 RepID=A0A835F7B3_9POAL|nr:hypothetical protein HU200_016735 [Digitaria exilis]CAB3491206.1 unnamed protein product [Digitaria exilis]
MHRRAEFSFPGSQARGLPPRPPVNTVAPRYGEEEVRWLQASRQGSPDYNSGGSSTPSPQLWAYNPDHLQNHHHRAYPASAGSSPSRAQAIAGYRREMLDLVRGLPESAYELSLRDIVEHPLATSSSSPPPPSDPIPQASIPAVPRQGGAAMAAAAREHDLAGGRKEAAAAAAADVQVQDGNKKQSSFGKKQGRKQRTTMRKQRSLERSVSLDTGLLIKFFLPISIGGKKKVSPKPDAAKDGKKKKEKKEGKKKKDVAEAAAAAAAQEEEWWGKNEFSEAGSSSRTSSTGSSNSSNGSIRNGPVNGGVNPTAPSRSWSR